MWQWRQLPVAGQGQAGEVGTGQEGEGVHALQQGHVVQVQALKRKYLQNFVSNITIYNIMWNNLTFESWIKIEFSKNQR